MAGELSAFLTSKLCMGCTVFEIEVWSSQQGSREWLASWARAKNETSKSAVGSRSTLTKLRAVLELSHRCTVIKASGSGRKSQLHDSNLQRFSTVAWQARERRCSRVRVRRVVQ